jgi:MFS family permease
MEITPNLLCDFSNTGEWTKCTVSQVCKNPQPIFKYDYGGTGSLSIQNWVEDMGLLCLDPLVLGMFGSVMYGGFAIMSFFAPRYSDTYGRKKVVIPGLIACVIIEAIMIFISRNFYFTLTLMFLYGLTGAFRISLVYLFLLDLTPKKYTPLVGSSLHVTNGITSGMSVIYTRYIYYYWVPW